MRRDGEGENTLKRFLIYDSRISSRFKSHTKKKLQREREGRNKTNNFPHETYTRFSLSLSLLRSSLTSE